MSTSQPISGRAQLRAATVLVTGANRGLGRALVEESLARGARRIYATARNPDALGDLAAQHPDRVFPLALDVTDRASIAAAAQRAPDVTVLINNAGILASYSVLTSSPAALAQDLATNATGMLDVTRAFLPALERAPRGSASLINIVSIAALANLPSLGGYSAAKATAHSLTQALRAELAPRSISVHAVHPGPIDTEMVRDLPGPKHSPADVARALLTDAESGLDEIFPDPTSQHLAAIYLRDPRELARTFASMAG